jgi:tRNA threonylcarbamoyladenosine biosynthesis protein TsaE
MRAALECQAAGACNALTPAVLPRFGRCDSIATMKKTIYLTTEADTQTLGRELAQSASRGDVIALAGDLGTGKTTLAQAIAEGLGVREAVTSPTFTILAEYDSGRIPFYHFDVYRVHDPDELFEIGFAEYLEGDGLCVVEWADLVEDLLPPGALRVRLEMGAGESERICVIG